MYSITRYVLTICRGVYMAMCAKKLFYIAIYESHKSSKYITACKYT